MELWLSLDTYKGIIGNLHGDLGRTDVTKLHPHRRRPITDWNRYDLEVYLGLCYFDCDINVAMTESAKVGTHPHDMYSYRLRGETSEGPVSWCNVYRQFFLINDPTKMQPDKVKEQIDSALSTTKPRDEGAETYGLHFHYLSELYQRFYRTPKMDEDFPDVVDFCIRRC